jgi:hypothetical protein
MATSLLDSLSLSMAWLETYNIKNTPFLVIVIPIEALAEHCFTPLHSARNDDKIETNLQQIF